MVMGLTGSLLTLAPWLPAIIIGLAFVGTGIRHARVLQNKEFLVFILVPPNDFSKIVQHRGEVVGGGDRV